MSEKAAVSAVCNETDALLQIKYNITKEEWDSSRPNFNNWKFIPLLFFQGDEVRYESYENLTDYEACLPRDACSEVVVGGLPTDAYTVSFDENAIDISHEFLFDGKNPITSTQIGTCVKPTCEDNEALLEIQYWNGNFYYKQHSFRVEDNDGTTILQGEPEQMFSVNQTFACLSKDDSCHTFLIGGSYQIDNLVFVPPSYSVFFDGELVKRSDSWLFDSVQIGNGCMPRCSEDSESAIEFFMYDPSQFDGEEHEYEWELNVTSSSALVSGVVKPHISPLAHEVMCIPKGSCSTFFISSLSIKEEIRDRLNPVYSLSMDGISYRKNQWLADESFYLGSNNETTHMGSCTVEGLCDKQTEDLFSLDIKTPAKLSSARNLPSVPTSDMRWEFGYSTYEGEWDPMFRDFFYNDRGYDLSSRFRVIECVPKDGCDLSFNITQGSPVDSYAVMKNGMQLDAQEVQSRFWEPLMTPFGQDCFPTSTLSGGAIAGIVAGCVVGVGMLVFGLVLYKRRRDKSLVQEGDEKENI